MQSPSRVMVGWEDKERIKSICEAVLWKNLFGLEIDPRCTQIAAFALALAAWKRVGEYWELPELNVACSGIALSQRVLHPGQLARRIEAFA